MASDFQFSENFNYRYQEIKNNFVNFSFDGIMDSENEYFSWPNSSIKLPFNNTNNNKTNELIHHQVGGENQNGDQINNLNNNNNNLRKRKFFNNNDNNIISNKKLHVIEAMKDVLSLNNNNNLLNKHNNEKNEHQNGTRITSWAEELTENLAAEFNGTFTDLGSGNYNVNDSLLSNLTVFKQEAPSPTSNENQLQNLQNPGQNNVDGADFPDSNTNQSTINSALQNLLGNGFNDIQSPIGNGAIDDSPSSQDLNRNIVTSSDIAENSRFQYVLAAATSIATKVNEDTLTYLNQGQSYEIKLKKLGDLSNYRGRTLKSIIRICFYERRLQYMEKEQMSLWQSSRPGDRIIEVDVPLSYGLREVTQPPAQLNAVHFQWDPTKEVGVYIKVNCISTEFTPKKHGGEKGVPFRIQVETYLVGESNLPPKRLHAAACQIKVFKLKGADRKHKQDREKIMKRPPAEQEKYQRSYDCTVLNDIPIDSLESPSLPIVNGVTSTVPGPFSPEGIPQNRPDYIQKIEDGIDDPNSPELIRCQSNSNLYNENQITDISNGPYVACSHDLTAQQVQHWLQCHRFGSYLGTFSGFSGVDMLRLTKEDLIQICDYADGIRLYNALHSKSVTPKLTIYVRREHADHYNAVYLMSQNTTEFYSKLAPLMGISKDQLRQVYFQGPRGIHIVLNDDVIKNIKDESMFSMELDSGSGSYNAILLKPIPK